MPYMQENNSSIIAYSPLDKGHGFYSDDKVQLMENLTKKYNKTTSQISLNWLLSQENVFVIPSNKNTLSSMLLLQILNWIRMISKK